jgi:hypothetical protein
MFFCLGNFAATTGFIVRKRSLIPFLRLNQRKFPVLSRLTGKIPAETGSLVTASTANYTGSPPSLWR